MQTVRSVKRFVLLDVDLVNFLEVSKLDCSHKTRVGIDSLKLYSLIPKCLVANFFTEEFTNLVTLDV